MIILAIETSCDDTGIAIIKVNEKKLSKIKVLSNLISSQVKIHQKYGGVYPSLAKREHQKNLPILFEKSKKEAKDPKIDLIAVTVGPGLDPCLWVGVNFAKDLAKNLGLPLLSINHIKAHIYANFLDFKSEKQLKDIFPAIYLIVSGGHTQLIFVKDFGHYKFLGETRDDAAGECFDKIGRMLGLGYPGGPPIEREAAKFKAKDSKFKVNLPRPMMHQKNYDFSFSGLKTAALYDYKERKPEIRKSKEYIRAISAETQQAIIDVLVKKTIKAAKEYKAKTVILGGGVIANRELRKQLKAKIKKDLPNTEYLSPDIKLSTDNALMIAITAYYQWLTEGSALSDDWKKVSVNANLRIEK
ncbi:MAG: tRNA (adenosine(37)-N6)-threonylcarbamoyltransferase complex transferase subunit TsaD [Patescibacteria group bacterium]|nr:tRNA (adenosine(37)-N6)-threonylcarbamoyltransferase complex transferase subunit TsaD [Patescibacteria group bacterium]